MDIEMQARRIAQRAGGASARARNAREIANRYIDNIMASPSYRATAARGRQTNSYGNTVDYETTAMNRGYNRQAYMNRDYSGRRITASAELVRRAINTSPSTRMAASRGLLRTAAGSNG